MRQTTIETGRRRRLAAAAAAFSIAAGAASLCAAEVVPSRATLPPPDAAANSEIAQEDYRIGPLDTLEVTVFHVDNLNRTVQVDSSGQINLPLIGTVAVSAKTSKQVADEIARRLGEKYLQAPQVSVLVSKSQSQKFTVEGAVRDSGVFDLQGRTTLLQAIAMTHGVNQGANLRSVVIFRTVQQKRLAAVVSLADVRSGKVDDPQIYAGDVIVVPESNSARILRSIIGVTPLMLLRGL